MNNKFSYTYSASQNAEVEAIRKKYAPQPQSDDKLERLKRLDKSCELPGKLFSIIIGIIGTFILGTGLALIFTQELYVAGAIIGVVGLGIMASAVPVFNKITEARRKQLAPEIIRLSEEISNNRS